MWFTSNRKNTTFARGYIVFVHRGGGLPQSVDLRNASLLLTLDCHGATNGSDMGSLVGRQESEPWHGTKGAGDESSYCFHFV